MRKTIMLIAAAVVLMMAGAAQGSLLAYYPFQGNANDATGHGYSGTTHNVTLTTGYQGNAYYFDGRSDKNSYIDIPLNINPTQYAKLTFGAWVKADSGATGAIRGIISHDNGGFDRTLDIDQRIGGSGNDTGWAAFTGSYGVLNSRIDPVAGQWTFLAVVYDSSTNAVTLYVNNQSFSHIGSNPGGGDATTYIGKNPHFDLPFKGVIDEVFFYDEALTGAQIENIRQNGVVPLPPGLLLLGSGLVGLVGWRKFRKG
jgi:hypothetical protein